MFKLKKRSTNFDIKQATIKETIRQIPQNLQNIIVNEDIVSCNLLLCLGFIFMSYLCLLLFAAAAIEVLSFYSDLSLGAAAPRFYKKLDMI